MKVTEAEKKESTKRLCGGGCPQRVRAEHEEYAEALIGKKRVRTRYRNLRKLEASTRNAGILANTRKGYWRTASSPILNAALSNERLVKAGFQMFLPYYKSVLA